MKSTWTISVLILVLLAWQIAVAGAKKVTLDFEPTHPASPPCLRSPFIVLLEESPFFKDLKEVKKRKLLEYHHGKEVVQTFPDELEIKVNFLPVPLLERCGYTFDPANLVFHVEWQDKSQSRQATGTFVQSEIARPVTWCEDNCLGAWEYELRIDSQDIPLTSDLLIQINSENGVHVAEYVGKLAHIESSNMLTSTLSPSP